MTLLPSSQMTGGPPEDRPQPRRWLRWQSGRKVQPAATDVPSKAVSRQSWMGSFKELLSACSAR